MLDNVNTFSVKFLKKLNFSVRFSDMLNMEGLTVAEMAEKLGIKETTVRQRLMIAGIRPITHSPVYPASALEAIRSVPGKGRPPKAKPEKK
jgi:predicted ArsR family transcriptional regulator